MPDQLQLIPDQPLEGKLFTIPVASIPTKYLSSSRKPDAAMRSSVRQFGVLTPILVCPETEHDQHVLDSAIANHEDQGDTLIFSENDRELVVFRLLAGRRRVLAAQEANVTMIHAVIFPYGTEPSTVTILENQVRSDNPLVELAEIQRLISQGADLPAISQATGLHVQTAVKRMKLLSLVPGLREALRDGKLGLSVAEMVSQMSAEDQERLVGIYQTNGRVKASDARSLRRAEAENAASALPDVMFNPNPDAIAFPTVEQVLGEPMVAMESAPSAPSVPHSAPPEPDSIARARALVEEATEMLLRLNVFPRSRRSLRTIAERLNGTGGSGE